MKNSSNEDNPRVAIHTSLRGSPTGYGGGSSVAKNPKQKTRKKKLIYATWNVQGISTKKQEIYEQLNKYKVDIAALTETKKKGSGYEEYGEYILFFSGVPKDKRARAGVAISIHKKLKSCIRSWEEIDERLLKMELNIWGHEIILLAVYAPTDDSNMELKDAFENNLINLLNNTSNRKEIILLGDFNARIGKKLNDPVIGNYGEDTTNNNGNRLITICEAYELKILNGHYQHREIHKFTWHQSTRGLKSIIDYFIVGQKTKWQIQDVRVFRGAECGSDHYLVKMTTYLSHRAVKQNSNQDQDKDNTRELKQRKYNIASLRDESTAFLYKVRLSAKLKNNMTGTAAQEYEKLKNAIHDAAFEALGEQKRLSKQKEEKWFNDEVDKLIAEKKNAYNKWLASNDPDDRRTYQQKRNQVNQKVKETKNKQWEESCARVEQHIGGTKTKEAWNIIRNLRKDHKGNNINMINIDKFQQYFSHMLAEDRKEYTQKEQQSQPINLEHLNEITGKEVQKAVRDQKNGRASGPGDIPAELLKHAPFQIYEILAYIFNRCLLYHDELPYEWKVGYLTPIHKKGSRKSCENYRGISVLATVGKLYGRVIKKRIEQQITIGEEQSGFTAGRSCTDNTYSLKQILEKRKLKNLDTHLIFIDLEKAFDTVPIQKLLQILATTNINHHYIHTIREMYKDQTNVIKISNKISDPFKTNKGVRQGCCLSPTLFKIYLEYILKEWKTKCRCMGLLIGDDYIHSLLFADDQVIMAGDEDDIEYMMRKLVDTYEANGLKINYKKTKYLTTKDRGNDLQIYGNTIVKSDDFKYLGSIISSDANSKKDITSRMGQARQAIQRLNSLLWSKSIYNNTKVRIYNSIVQTILIYGSETWELSKRHRQQINAVEMDFLRRGCRVSKLEHVTNVEIRNRMQKNSTSTEEIEKRRLLWYGHIQRMNADRWPNLILKWNPPGRRKRGRPPDTWIKQVQEDMRDRNLEEESWNDKYRWRLGCEKRH